MRKILFIFSLAMVLMFGSAPVYAQGGRPAPTPSIVFAAHDPDSVQDYRVNGRVVHNMVDRLVMAVTGQPNVAAAWASLVAPEDKIGIKISAAGGELFTTHHEVVTAIVDGLEAAGHPRNKVIVWDRSLTGIKEAGYNSSADGFQMRSVPPREGYDPKAVFSAPLLGKLVWGDFEYKAEPGKTIPLSDTENTSNISHFSRILANDVTKVVNVPSMSNTEMNGIAGCLYNMTIPNIDNWRRFTQGSGFGAGSIAEIYSDPVIQKKVVLNIMDGLVAQYAGGPESQPQFAVHHATLYASRDPVAVDAIALKRLEQWRVRSSLPSFAQMTEYVKAASLMGLGNDEAGRIQVKNVGRVPAE